MFCLVGMGLCPRPLPSQGSSSQEWTRTRRVRLGVVVAVLTLVRDETFLRPSSQGTWSRRSQAPRSGQGLRGRTHLLEVCDSSYDITGPGNWGVYSLHPYGSGIYNLDKEGRVPSGHRVCPCLTDPSVPVYISV